MNDQMTKGSETGERPTVGRPLWQRPEVSVLDVDRGTLSGAGPISDNPSGSES